jgi:porphobilinogen synthase
MNYPAYRARRLRRTENLRRMVRETQLSVDDLVYPLFVTAGSGVQREIHSLPGQYHWSTDTVVQEARRVQALGIPAVLLFGLPERKDPRGEAARDPDGPVQRSAASIKDACPDLVVITDVCLCEYTDHGHCGLVEDGEVLNDSTLEVLAQVALSHVEAGADIVAPSDMMDGRVGAIREALDEEGWEDVVIMSYAAKYASAFYGPFREAAGSAPQFGDRRSYQMDPPNVREALREVEMDIQEGADIVMVKPALAYLDVIQRVSAAFDHPLAAYNVSGEYVMVKSAAAQGLIDERRIVLELLTGIRRAGADIIITYHAPEVAQWLREG